LTLIFEASTKDAIIVIERLLDDSQVHFGLPTLRTILTDEQVAAVTEKMLLYSSFLMNRCFSMTFSSHL